MNGPATPDRDRLLDLLLERSEGTLDARGAEEIERLLARCPDVDPVAIEAALAATHVALLGGAAEPLPPALARVLEQQARDFREGSGRAPSPDASQGPRRSPFLSPVLAWTAAAGSFAALLLMLARAPERPVEVAAAARRARLVAEGSALEVPWQPTEDELGQGVRGDVVWDNARQEGYLRFVDLAPNDAARHQYQLWIFDARRPSETPVDGGVFDVPPGAGEVVVPIDAKLAVHEPTLFAVTLERPGGVVVSSRERLLLTAAVN